jgi:7-keto-8-aminopelargonate synthetase-like enzyme
MGTPCSTNREKRNAYRISVGKSEGKGLQRRPRRRKVNNIKIDLREIKWGSVDWIDLAQDRDQWRALVKAVRNFGFL